MKQNASEIFAISRRAVSLSRELSLTISNATTGQQTFKPLVSGQGTPLPLFCQYAPGVIQ
jgi:hypothetical protein